MDSLQYSAGERNHYFYGKLMTARDFEDEQTYFNNKRRLGNRMLHGAGIVSGLGVLLVDNQTISLEAGMALDYLGREIIVREPSVKRISVIPGYDAIRQTGDVYLGIAYSEELSESTFSAAGISGEDGVKREYNRVQEGYELFLTAKEPDPLSLGIDRVLYDICRLYDEGGVTIVLRIPKYVNINDSFKVQVLFEKKDVSTPVSFSFDIESNLFQGKNGEKSIRVEYVETEVTTHKELTLDYTMSCGPVREDYAEILIPAEKFTVSKGKSETAGLAETPVRSVQVTVRPLRELVTEAYFACHFDDLLTTRNDQAIYLAKLHVIASQSSFFIEKITRNPFRQYLPNVQLLDLLQSLGGGQGKSEPVEQPPQARDSQTPKAAQQPHRTATGVETVLLGMSPKAGRSYFSHEFIHGLGAGNVCVVVAVENTEGVGSPNTLLFGDGVFTAEKFSLAAPACAAGAMVNVKKGTIQLGVRLLEKTDQQSIRLRWWAWMADGEQMSKDELISDIQVLITPNTVNLEPLQQQRFTAIVEGSASQEVNWTVVDKNGGSIDRNGLYTAPATEGVFEIQAQSAKFGTYRASAYVVVGKL